jgi:hypothetical protein
VNLKSKARCLSARALITALLLSSLASLHAPAGTVRTLSAREPFVTVVDGKFRVGAQEYRAMGFTAYELNVGKDQRKNPREKVERIFRVAKLHGFTLFRATTIIYEFNMGDLKRHLSEPVWSQIDMILDVARTLGMRVIIDFSTLTYDTGKHSSPPFDVTAPENFDRIKDVYRIIPNRRNTINGRLYRDDPTIMAYSILGEIVPFGLNRLPDGGVDLKNESRDVNNYLSFVASAAAELKRNAPRQLVNTGGLLHITPTGPVKDKSGSPYWKALWADRNIDFGSIHIYSHPPKELERPVCPPYQVPMPWGEWRNLVTYVDYTAAIGKPFVVEEWGLNLDARSEVSAAGGTKPLELSPETARDFMSSAFAAMRQAKVPVSVMWQWSPGGCFNIWPGESAFEDSLIKIITDQNAYFRPR